MIMICSQSKIQQPVHFQAPESGCVGELTYVYSVKDIIDETTNNTMAVFCLNGNEEFVFRVKAVNLGGVESDEAIYRGTSGKLGELCLTTIFSYYSQTLDFYANRQSAAQPKLEKNNEQFCNLT